MKTIPWNVVTGCERLTPGCDNCPTYWEYKAKGKDYSPKEHPEILSEPVRNPEQSIYVVAPGSDLFHESVSVDHIKGVFNVMLTAYWHQFEIITKRAERMEMFSNRYIQWPNNVVAGVAVEEAKYKWRIDCLRNIRANRMVSFGPITGRIGKVNLKSIHIAGAVIETWGPKPRPVKQKWIDEIHKQCREQGVLVSEESWLAKESA
jgi:protein gp37